MGVMDDSLIGEPPLMTLAHKPTPTLPSYRDPRVPNPDPDPISTPPSPATAYGTGRDGGMGMIGDRPDSVHIPGAEAALAPIPIQGQIQAPQGQLCQPPGPLPTTPMWCMTIATSAPLVSCWMPRCTRRFLTHLRMCRCAYGAWHCGLQRHGVPPEQAPGMPPPLISPWHLIPIGRIGTRKPGRGCLGYLQNQAAQMPVAACMPMRTVLVVCRHACLRL